MSKIDEYNKAKLFLREVKIVFNSSGIRFDFVKDQPNFLLQVFNLSITMDKTLRRALNHPKVTEAITETAIELAELDLEKARREAIEEAKEILNQTEEN